MPPSRALVVLVLFVVLSEASMWPPPSRSSAAFNRLRLSHTTVRLNKRQSDLCPVQTSSTLKPPVAPRVASSRTFSIPDGPTNVTATITDYYEWLANKSDPLVMSYICQEQDYLLAVTNHTNVLQRAIYREMQARIPDSDEEYISIEVTNNGYVYYCKYLPGKPYLVWFRYPALQSRNFSQVVLDENEVYANLTHGDPSDYFAIGALAVSPDNNYLAYSVDLVGNDSHTIYFRDLVANQTLFISLPNNYYSIEWASPTTIYYNTINPSFKQADCIYRYTLNTLAPILVYTAPNRTFEVSLQRSNNGEYIFLYVQGMVTNEVRFVRTSSASIVHNKHCDGSGILDFCDILFRPMAFGTQVLSADHYDNYFYFLSNADGNFNFQLMAVSDTDASVATVIIGHNSTVTLTRVRLYDGGRAVLWDIDTVATLQRIRTFAVDQPDNAVFVTDLFAERQWYGLEPRDGPTDDFVMRYTDAAAMGIRFLYETMTRPPTELFYNFSANVLEPVQSQAVPDYDPTKYATARVFVPIPDNAGTAPPYWTIPVTLAWRRDLVGGRTGRPGDTHVELPRGNDYSALLLMGYGAYGDVKWPHFDSTRLALLDRGIVYAIAHTRGGGIRGMQWYNEGKWLCKENTFADFAAVADWLVQHRVVASHARLAIYGRSAGGLLMGATLATRPDIARVVWAQVPFVDVIQGMTRPWLPWVEWEYYEWGNPLWNATWFDYMRAYDPMLLIQNSSRSTMATHKQPFPHVMLQAGWNDPIVGYWEPTKFIANLRATWGHTNSTFVLYVEDAGHLGTTGLDYYQALALQYAFVIDKLLQEGGGSDNDEWGTNAPTAVTMKAVFITLMLVTVGILVAVGAIYFLRYRLGLCVGGGWMGHSGRGRYRRHVNEDELVQRSAREMETWWARDENTAGMRRVASTAQSGTDSDEVVVWQKP